MLVRVTLLLFAFLLPFLTWQEAAGGMFLALLFYAYWLPQLSQQNAPDQASATRLTPVVRSETLYVLSLLALILIFRHQKVVVAGAWAVLALGLVLRELAEVGLNGPALPWNPQEHWPGFIAFLLAGTPGAYLLARWVAPALSPAKTWQVCLATALTGALASSAPIRLDPHVVVALVAGGFMFCALLIEQSALASNLPYLGVRIVLAVVVNAAFAALAWAFGFATRSGALAGFLLGVAIYLGYGWKSFLILLGFFVLASVVTRLGYAEKARRGTAESRGGARSWREALANLLSPAFFSILVITTHYEPAFLGALVAALAEAAGDTASSEIGQWLSERAYLVTTLKFVPAGEDGAVSLSGTVAGLLASAMIAALGVAVGICRPGVAVLALGAAVAGNLLDSLLGATLERRGLLTNEAVNFAGTSFAGALVLAFLISK